MYDTLILIPYRNRKQHLDYFITNTVPILEHIMPNSRVIIIEQDNSKLFNRGLLLNIGFNEYKNTTTYFMTHDVDINPISDTILKYYTKDISDNAIMGIYTSQYNTLGGIIKMKSTIPEIVNGFPNNFWGWGAEDKALQNRCEFMNISISKNILNNDPNRFKYFTIFNDVEDRHISPELNMHTHTEYYKYPLMTTKQKTEHIHSSGISTLKYIVNKKLQLNSHVEHIFVDFE
jgi:hypothetical protein